MVLALSIGLIGAILMVHLIATIRERRAESAYPPSEDRITVDGTRVNVWIEGEGPDLILIHGANGSLRDFTFSLTKQLSTSYRVIAFDRPGQGWTDRLPGYGGWGNRRAETPSEQATLLRNAARKLGVKRPIILGHSYGGAVALAWGLDAPDDVSALVLLAGAANPWPGGLGFLYAVQKGFLGNRVFIPLATAFWPERLLHWLTDSIFAPQTVPDGYLAHFGARMSLRRRALRANEQQLNGLRPHIVEMSHRYDSLTMPIEILHGDEDEHVPVSIHARPLDRLAQTSNLTVLPGIGHMPHHSDAEASRKAIDRAAARAGLRSSDEHPI